jgi:hypothetical protein
MKKQNVCESQSPGQRIVGDGSLADWGWLTCLEMILSECNKDNHAARMNYQGFKHANQIHHNRNSTHETSTTVLTQNNP